MNITDSLSYDIPDEHPRATSLRLRKQIEAGVAEGITSPAGLIAHGRGEAFDYLLGEVTHDFAKESCDAAHALLLAAYHPVLSVNGNSAALCPHAFVLLAEKYHAKIEVNIFHTSRSREFKIKEHLLRAGATEVLLPTTDCELPHLTSNRRFIHPEGIAKADVVFVPLEDGDRAEALVEWGKKVITIDLNPLSRTARTATITIVDHINRAMKVLQDLSDNSSQFSSSDYDNDGILARAERTLRTLSRH
jgi:4-phosphopantoate---beta-alanine ligase